MNQIRYSGIFKLGRSNLLIDKGTDIDSRVGSRNSEKNSWNTTGVPMAAAIYVANVGTVALLRIQLMLAIRNSRLITTIEQAF